MDKALRKTGFFFGSIFIAGWIYTTIIHAVSSGSLLETLASRNSYLSFAVALLFFASALWTKAKWIQPAIFLILSPFTLHSDPTSFFGLGFFVIAVALLVRMGFFDSHRVIKLLLGFLFFVVSEASSIATAGGKPIDALGGIFFMVVFLVFLYLAFQEKLAVYLKEPKRELSLKEKGLATTERAYTLAFASGKTTKEVAFDFGVSESTVRNTLARSYKKLGVDDKSGLSALAERFHLID